jgi:hypothetical protein
MSYRSTGFFWGHSGPSGRPRALTAAQRDEIKQRHTEGETVASLALEFGVSVQTVRLYAGEDPWTP